jgi:hypothetical protein
VFKLRTLLDRANDVNLNCSQKLSNTSRTLQVIQSRLSYKQQQYTAALLNTDSSSNQYLNYLSDEDEELGNKSATTGVDGNYDEEDNESFVSATSVIFYSSL